MVGQAVKARMKRFDARGKLRLYPEELKALMQSLGLQFSEEQLEAPRLETLESTFGRSAQGDDEGSRPATARLRRSPAEIESWIRSTIAKLA